MYGGRNNCSVQIQVVIHRTIRQLLGIAQSPSALLRLTASEDWAMAAGLPGGVPVLATPWGGNADRQDAPIAAYRMPTALATPDPITTTSIQLALAMPLPQNAGIAQNECALLVVVPTDAQDSMHNTYAPSAH
eukprot:6201764-Pleurochrysis_carterae.AAC.2